MMTPESCCPEAMACFARRSPSTTRSTPIRVAPTRCSSPVPAVIDALGIWLIAISIFGPSMRPFIGLLLIFALRQLMQALCALPTPEGMIWHNPGVPSFLVTYQVANDFFFSGHTAIAVFGATQLARLKRPGFLALGVAIALFEIATVLVLRAHYTMDVFTGAIVALWAAHIADRAAPMLDRSIVR